MYSNVIKKEKIDAVVTLDQAKKQLNVDADFTDDDSHILALIDAATGAAEDYTASDIALTRNTLEFIRFEGQQIIINEAPYDVMESVTADGQDIPKEDFEVMDKRSYFVITFKEVVRADKLVVVFLTGYHPDTAPPPLSAAILVKVNDLYDVERTSYTIGNFKDNKTFDRLLNGHVINRW
jgi:hypothetical protein